MNRTNKAKIAIIGGGVAGSSAAIHFGELGLDVTLFEKESSLISGPPFCHLHAGGNLYPDISDAQCLTLLKQSIDFAKMYPYVVDYRPTVIALPLSCDTSPEDLMPRIKLLRSTYDELIKKDASNQVLGKSDAYFRCYSKKELEELRQKEIVDTPQNADEWMIPVAKNIAFEKIQFPLIMVQEYGLNLFRLAAGSKLALQSMQSVTLHTDTVVSNIQKEHKNNSWNITYVKNDETYTQNYDYLINAAGFRTGKIDDMLGVECERMVEFKAAYISHWKEAEDILFPEIIFHGKRGTPEGMGQFTPYPKGYFQLHGMTHDITLYNDGLVSNTNVSCQPKLNQDFIKKIAYAWSKEEITSRTQRAIEHLSKFIPHFSEATVASKPLFGAQQIPGDDPTLRVAEVSFPKEKYARCEIVKVSSVTDMIESITKEFVKLRYIDVSLQNKREYAYLKGIKELEIDMLAQMLCEERQYPPHMARRTVPSKIYFN